MRRPFILALLGLFMALGSSSRLHAQRIMPTSYEDLVSRLESVESKLTTQPETAWSSDQICSDGCTNSCCEARGGLFVTYENVWIKPFFNHNGAFQIFNAIPNTGESVEIVEFDWSFRSTPRVELGYLIPCSGLGWRARYWQFNSSTSTTATDPGEGNIAVGLHDDPDIEVNTADDEFARASHALDLDVVDLEVIMRRESNCSEFTFSGGLRYLRMDQDYRASFTNFNTGIVDDIVVSNHFFEGFGPTLGLEGVRRLGTSSLSLFGKTRGSLLLGDSGLDQASIDPQDIAEPIGDFVTTSNTLDFQFIAELQVGVQCERCLSNGSLLFGRLGAEVQYWPSAGSGAYQNGEDNDGHGEDPRDSDMLLFGLSASVGGKW